MRCGIKQRSSSCVNLETSAESGYLCGTKQAAKSTYSSDRTVMQAACKTLATSTRQHLSHANYVCVSYCRQHLMASRPRDTEIDRSNSRRRCGCVSLVTCPENISSRASWSARRPHELMQRPEMQSLCIRNGENTKTESS